jgi:hypothetical protein
MRTGATVACMLHRGSRINLYPVERHRLVPKSCILEHSCLLHRICRERSRKNVSALIGFQSHHAGGMPSHHGPTLAPGNFRCAGKYPRRLVRGYTALARGARTPSEAATMGKNRSSDKSRRAMQQKIHVGYDLVSRRAHCTSTSMLVMTGK